MAVLVIDVGSSSVRTLLYDDDAQLIQSAIVRRPYQFYTDENGASQINADTLRNYVEQCIDDILTHKHASHITAVGFTTFVGNLLGIDEHNGPTTPIYTYADRQSVEDLQLLENKINADDVHQRTGCMHHTAYHPARLHWLQRTQPDVYQETVQWLDFATYCYRHWFGRHVPCSYSVASWGGLLNRENLTWDTQWLNTLGMSTEQFPELADFDDTQTQLSGDYVKRWSQLYGVPFFLALGDGAVANVGSGAINGEIALTIGTTAALRIISKTPLPEVPRGLWSYRLDQPRHLIGGATSEGGNIFAWANNTLQVSSTDIDRILSTRPPTAHGLTFIPLLNGERSPNWNALARGTIHGIRLDTDTVDIVQAALEGVVHQLGAIAERLPDTDKIFAGGGAIYQSQAWTQLLADGFGRPIHVLDEPEISARGVALLLQQRESTPPQFKTIVEPRQTYISMMREAKDRHQALYHRLYS